MFMSACVCAFAHGSGFFCPAPKTEQKVKSTVSKSSLCFMSVVKVGVDVGGIRCESLSDGQDPISGDPKLNETVPSCEPVHDLGFRCLAGEPNTKPFSLYHKFVDCRINAQINRVLSADDHHRLVGD